MILVFAFAGSVNSWNARRLILPINPDAAHGVVHGGKNLHGLFSRIDAEKLFVDFEDAFELAVQSFSRDMRDVEIDGGFALESQLFLIHDAMNRARGDVARDEIAVFRDTTLPENKTARRSGMVRGAR